MFYSQYVLAKKGPLGKIWLAAHMEKKLPKVQIMATDIPESVNNIENPSVPMALRMSGHLLLGVVRIFSKKVVYLLTDCSEAMVKIKDAFRGPGTVDLAPGAATRRYDDITNSEHFDEMDLDAGLPSTMSFAMDDDALVGITVPDDQMGIDDGGFGFEDGNGLEGQSGFGHNEDFQVFFEKPDHEPDMPAEKRRRTMEPSAAAEDEQEEEEEDMLPEMEHARSAAEPQEPGVMQTDMETAAYEQPFDEPATFEEFAEQEEITGLDDVIAADDGRTRRSSTGASSLGTAQPEEEASAQPEEGASQGAAKQGARKSVKRKVMMLLDADLQISNSQMKKQVTDTASIVSDFVADGQAIKKREPPPDLFSGPPGLLLLPPEVLELECFQPGKLNVASNKQQRGVGETEKPCGRGHTSVQEAPSDEDPAKQADEMHFGGDQFGDGQFSGEQFGAEHFGETQGMGEDAQFVEQQPGAEEERSSPLPSFSTSQQLPTVDGNEMGARDKGGSQGVAEAAAAWSARTQQMHAMLDRAFSESKGMALSFDAMAAKSKGPQKRRVVAGCFQELLFLTTHGLLELQQHQPYADIVISKTDDFDAVVVTS